LVHHRHREDHIVKLKGFIACTAVACLGIGIAGCSSDSKSSSSTTTTTAKDAVCSDKSALESSVKALVNPSTLSGGKSSITSAIDKVKKDLDALGASVKADLKPQVDAVKSAVDDVKTDVGNFGNGSLSENLSTTGTAIAKVGSTAADLESSLSSKCPSS
jgi:tetrahydromethanopterin S-methyltransferase subunit F